MGAILELGRGHVNHGVAPVASKTLNPYQRSVCSSEWNTAGYCWSFGREVLNCGWQVRAVVERFEFDAGDTCGNGDVGQTHAIGKGPLPDASNIRRERIISSLTGRTSNEFGLNLVEQNAVPATVVGIGRFHFDGHQAGATEECRLLDAGDTCGNGDVGQAVAECERINAETGNRVST